MSVVIPDKTYFKIGEVAKLIQVKPYILRYWESEFRVLRPQKTRSRHRLYRRRDVEILCQIRHLLYEEKYTIAGAKVRIQELIKEGRFVPGKSGLVITESEVEKLVDDSGVSAPELEPGDEIDVVQLTADPQEALEEPEAVELARGSAAELATLRRELAAARAAAAADQRQLEDALRSVRAELDETRAALESVDQSSPQDSNRDDEHLAQVEALRGELDTVREALSASQAEVTALGSERDGLLATRERVREKLRERNDVLKDLQAQLASLETQLDTERGARAELERALADARARATRAEEALANARKHGDGALAAATSAHEAERRRLVEAHASELEVLRTAFDEERAELTTAHESRIEQLEHEHAGALDARRREFDEELERTREQHEAEVVRLGQEYETRQAALRQESERLTGQLASLKVVREDHRELSTDHAALRDELDALQPRHARLQAEYDGLLVSVRDLERDLDEARQARTVADKVAAERAARIAELERVAGDSDTLRAELETLRAANDSLEQSQRRRATRRRALSRDLRMQLVELSQLVQRP